MTFAKTASLAALLLLPVTTARASSDDAWKQFAADVKSKCTAALAGQLVKPKLVVDPTGSEHFGLAIATGEIKGAKSQRASFVCVYDKVTKMAEIGSELGSDTLKVTIPGT